MAGRHAEPSDTVLTSPGPSAEPSSEALTLPLAQSTEGSLQAWEELSADLIDREDRAKYRARLMRTLRIGVAIWLGFAVLDVVALAWGLGPWWLYALARGVPVVGALLLRGHLKRRRDAGRPLLRTYETVAFALATLCTSFV